MPDPVQNPSVPTPPPSLAQQATATDPNAPVPAAIQAPINMPQGPAPAMPQQAQPQESAWLLEILNKGTDPVSDGTPRSLLEIQGPVTYKGSAPFLGVLGIR